jgi:hypothetical protein
MMSFAGKYRTRDHDVLEKAKFEKSIITCSHSFMEPTAEMMVIAMVIMGHECERQTVWGTNGSRGKDAEG